MYICISKLQNCRNLYIKMNVHLCFYFRSIYTKCTTRIVFCHRMKRGQYMCTEETDTHSQGKLEKKAARERKRERERERERERKREKERERERKRKIERRREVEGEERMRINRPWALIRTSLQGRSTSSLG